MSDKYVKVTDLTTVPGLLNSNYTTTGLSMFQYFDNTVEINGNLETVPAVVAGDTILDLTKVFDLNAYQNAAVLSYGFVTGELTDSTVFPISFAGSTNLVRIFFNAGQIFSLSIIMKLFPRNVSDKTIHIWGN